MGSKINYHEAGLLKRVEMILNRRMRRLVITHKGSAYGLARNGCSRCANSLDLAGYTFDTEIVVSRSSSVITAQLIHPGVVQVRILTRVYGQAGKHWRRVLGGPNHGGYGRIFIERTGANQRRYENCYDSRGDYRGNPAINLDECPGAMFIWTGSKEADVEPICAVDNQKLGRELGHALRPYPQRKKIDLWEVVFRFL